MKRMILLLGITVFTYMSTSISMGDTSVESAAPDKDTKPPKIKVVNIITKHLGHSLKKPHVQRRCEELKFSDNEQIIWIIVPPTVEFTVEFKGDKGSPFKDPVFTGEGYIESGPIVNYHNRESGDDEYFAYTLKVAGHDDVDPGIIVWD